jgi:glycine/D-amino acid oxidase-like deaminating enzyme
MQPLRRKRIAVLGAGIQGVSTALALAEMGHEVDLFEREEEALSGASLWNEGKIHLGYLYANDDIQRTTERMLDGAGSFSSILSRYVNGGIFSSEVSDTFTYAVHRESLLDAERIEHHFARVSEAIRARNWSREYFSIDGVHKYRRLSQAELEESYGDEKIAAAIETKEISIDTFIVAKHLRNAIVLNDRIEFHGRTFVKCVRLQDDGRYSVDVNDSAGAPGTHEKYDAVVNALWGDRLRIDAEMGLAPARPFRYRYKLAIHGRGVSLPKCVRSTTVVLGEFGDVVVFPSGRLYLSWYPACLIGESAEITPPDWAHKAAAADKGRILNDAMSELGAIVRGLADANLADADMEIKGGVIFSWGKARIGDLADEVHHRMDIGVTSRGGYHSIDTGKYGMAPLFAEVAAKRISGD